MHRHVAIAIALAAVGCGGGSPDGGADAQGDTPSDSATPPAGYEKLIGRAWTAEAGANIYRCVRFTVPADMYITNVMAQAAPGTHHTVLSFAGGNGTAGVDGDHDCGNTSIGTLMLYASSVGTEPLDFPDGVALKVAAGQQLHLNLHLLNAGDERAGGETTIWVKAQASAPAMLAEMVLAGPLDINVPSDGQPHEVTGECTATSPFTLFAVWPHMHTFATHQKVELARGANATVLHDRAFDFEEQTYFAMRPMVNVTPGERVRVTCTYVNTSGQVVTYGDSATQEMCFAGLYRFPSAGSNQYCPN